MSVIKTAELTDQECQAYRSAPLSFNEMLRKCHMDGYIRGYKAAETPLFNLVVPEETDEPISQR